MNWGVKNVIWKCLKYWGNNENYIFTIDNANVLKRKRSQFSKKIGKNQGGRVYRRGPVYRGKRADASKQKDWNYYIMSVLFKIYYSATQGSLFFRFFITSCEILCLLRRVIIISLLLERTTLGNLLHTYNMMIGSVKIF